MKNFRAIALSLTVGAGLALAATSASADGYKRRSIKDAPSRDKWTGCYIGLHGGYGWADTEGRASNFANTQNLNYDYSDSGGLAGGHIGCDYRIHSSFVLGVVGDYDWTRINGSQDNITDAVNFPGFFYTHSTDIDRMASLRARAGWVLPSHQLLYVTGGWAWAHTEHSLGFTGAASPFLTYTDSRSGWTLGAGIEGYILPHVTAFVEYRFTQIDGGLVVAPAVNARDSLEDTNIHTLRVGFSFRP
jgi:outer membrane immunogenic protein